MPSTQSSVADAEFVCTCVCVQVAATIMKLILLSVAVLVALLGPQGVHSRSGGAPVEACDTVTPAPSAHGAPQTSEVPYFVYLDPLCNNGYLMYTPGETYTRKLCVHDE